MTQIKPDTPLNIVIYLNVAAGDPQFETSPFRHSAIPQKAFPNFPALQPSQAISVVVDSMYKRILADDSLRPFFPEDTRVIAHLKEKLTILIEVAFGKESGEGHEHKYHGRRTYTQSFC